LYDFVQIRLCVSNGRAIAPLLQASLLDLIPTNLSRDHIWWISRGQVLLLSSVKRWMHALARRRRSKQFYDSVWQWIVRLVPGYDDSPRHEGPKGIRHSITRRRLRNFNRSRYSPLCLQWTPLALDDVTGRHEESLVKALAFYGAHFVSFPRDREVVSTFDSLVQIMDCWDVWIELLSAKRRPHDRIAFLVRMSSLYHSNPKGRAEPLSDPWSARYRLTCINESVDDSDSPNLHFSVDMDPSLALYYGPEFMARGHASALLKAVPLEQKQVDVLIDAVRQSMELDEDQKECMIDGIRAFKVRGPKT
jgi:hypothetical protein